MWGREREVPPDQFQIFPYAFLKIRVLAAVVFLVAALAACSAGTDAMVRTLQTAVGRDSGISGARLNPNFRYLRVTVGGRVALLVLGNEDSHAQGPIQVWFSAQKEVLRFQNGRTVGAVGLTTEWREVSLTELQSWSVIARSGEPVPWTRVRDVMPGYRFGVRDALVVRVVPPPRKSELQGMDPQSLTWFEERVEPERRAGGLGGLGGFLADDMVLPPARYAVDLRDGKETVVYGEQCLAVDLCFAWQRWPTESADSKGK